VTPLPVHVVTCEHLSLTEVADGFTCGCDSRLVEDARAGLAGPVAVFACVLLWGALVWVVWPW
jgi:hypothetical protein